MTNSVFPFSTYHPGPQHCLLLVVPLHRPDQCHQQGIPPAAPGQSRTLWPLCVRAGLGGLRFRPSRLGGGGRQQDRLDAWSRRGVCRQKRPHLRLSGGRLLDDLVFRGRVLSHDEAQHPAASSGRAYPSQGAAGLRLWRGDLLQPCQHDANLYLHWQFYWEDVPLLLPRS